MNNFFWLLAGESFINPKIHSEKAQSKYARIGASLLIPMVLWFAMGYFFVTSFTEGSNISAVGAGLVGAFIILILDRLMLNMSGSTWKSLAMRVVLAVIPAILNAVVVDMHMFEKDIAPMVETYRTEQLRSTFENQHRNDRFELEELNVRISEAKREVEMVQQEYFAEMDGDGGSGRGGYGRIAQRKELALNRATQAYDQLVQERNEMVSGLDEQWAALLDEELAQKAGILVQVTVFFEFVKSNPIALYVFALFFALVCILELIPVLAKIFISDTDYDHWKDSNDQRSKRKIEIEEHRSVQRGKRLKSMTDTDIYIQSVLDQSPLS